MKLFLSWSGIRSGKIAKVFKTWIKDVIQSSEPFYSTVDIGKGEVSLGVLANELAGTRFGILFLTPANLNSNWIMYEAGALSKEKTISRVCPFLFGLRNSDLIGPIAQYQATDFDKEDVFALVSEINNAIEGSLDPQRLQKAFDTYWPEFESAVVAILADETEAEKVKKRTSDEILEEILQIVRTSQRNTSLPHRDKFSNEVEFSYLADAFCQLLAESYRIHDFHLFKKLKMMASVMKEIIMKAPLSESSKKTYLSIIEEYLIEVDGSMELASGVE